MSASCGLLLLGSAHDDDCEDDDEDEHEHEHEAQGPKQMPRMSCTAPPSTFGIVVVAVLY